MSGQSISGGTKVRDIHGIVLVLAAVMPAMAIISLVPVLDLYMAEFGGSSFLKLRGPKAVLFMMTVPALCVALFSPVAGWLSDRVGRKKLLVTALLGYAIIGTLPYFLTDFKQIVSARIGLGVFEAIIMTMATALIGDYYKGKERERWIGIQVAIVSLSAIVLIALGGFLGEVIGSRGPFLMYLLAIPIALVSAAVLFEPDVIQKTRQAKESLPWGKLIPLLAITLGVGVFFYTSIVKLSLILGLTSEVSSWITGVVGAIFNTGVALGTLLFAKIKGFSGPKLLAIGMAFFAVGYAGMGLSGAFATTVLFAFITSLGAGLLLPTTLTWTMHMLPNKLRGRGTGLWTGMFFLGQFVAPLVSEAVSDSSKGLGNSLVIYGIAAACFMVIAAIFSRGAKSLTQEH